MLCRTRPPTLSAEAQIAMVGSASASLPIHRAGLVMAPGWARKLTSVTPWAGVVNIGRVCGEGGEKVCSAAPSSVVMAFVYAGKYTSVTPHECLRNICLRRIHSTECGAYQHSLPLLLSSSSPSWPTLCPIQTHLPGEQREIEAHVGLGVQAVAFGTLGVCWR